MCRCICVCSVPIDWQERCEQQEPECVCGPDAIQYIQWIVATLLTLLTLNLHKIIIYIVFRSLTYVFYVKRDKVKREPVLIFHLWSTFNQKWFWILDISHLHDGAHTCVCACEYLYLFPPAFSFRWIASWGPQTHKYMYTATHTLLIASRYGRVQQKTAYSSFTCFYFSICVLFHHKHQCVREINHNDETIQRRLCCCYYHCCHFYRNKNTNKKTHTI